VTSVPAGCRWQSTCQDLNLGPHPYQLNAGNRCADRGFRRSRLTVGSKLCVHPVLRSTHTWLLLAFGTTPYLILCTAVCLPSDHSYLEGCSSCDARPSFVLREKEFGEAAQAPERSRFNGSKRKVQVCGYL
jgi:hypothetical protein